MLPAGAVPRRRPPPAPEPPAPPPTLTTAATARRLGLSRASVLRALDSGKIKGVKILGTWRVDPAALEELLTHGNAD